MPYSIRRPLSNDEQLKLADFSPLLAHLLFHRGFAGAVEAREFISPDYEMNTHDPFLLKDAEKAAVRIIQAIENKERIAIYADYDADGIPGAVIWNDFFKRIAYENYSIYIPHRHDEGFGLNVEAVEQLAGEGVKLVITVDCGIADVLPVKRAVELGLEVIITDHHEAPPPAGGGLPPAFAIVDHKQADCVYPDKNLCGSGVAFKVIQALLKKARQGSFVKELGARSKELGKEGGTLDRLLNFKEGHEKWLLDLVGLATLSDMVPLVGENRVFAYYGLQVLRKSPRKGLIQLLYKLKIKQRYVTEDDIAFMITPRINAASRMGVPMDAFKLLAADNDVDADVYAKHLDEINNDRKAVVATLVKEIKKTLRERHGSSVPSVIVLGNPSWRPSLLGLAANSCAQEFDRPVFLWGRDGDNVIKGSCRSEGRTHVVELMRAVPAGTLSQFGGHKHSGGFAVADDAVHYLERRLNVAQEARSLELGAGSSDNSNTAENPKGSDLVDAELSLSDLTWNLYNDIAKLAPFGIGNPKPLFLLRNVIASSVRRFGKGNEHIELIFKKANAEKVSAISFFGVENTWAEQLKDGDKIDLVASLEKSMFKGTPELRLRVVDVVLL